MAHLLTLRVALPETPLDDGREPNALSPEQLIAFFTAMRTHYPQHYAMVVLLAYTGLRWCHASALRWEDFDEAGPRRQAPCVRPTAWTARGSDV